jgi:flagellar biosynthesis protein FliR
VVIHLSAWWNFLLVFVRITTFLVTAPLFSGRQIPSIYKVGFGFALSVLCVGMVSQPIKDPALGTYVLLILKECFVGIVFGLVATILFYAVQLAGSLIDTQIGFSMVTMFDPNFGVPVTLIGQFQNLLAILIMLVTDGHHLLIQGILASFDWISLSNWVPAITDGRVSTFLLEGLQKLFMIGFMMAAPMIGTLFLVDVAMGIVARTVPQMNIFTVGLPIKISIGLLVYILILPSFFYLTIKLFQTIFASLQEILKIMGA